MTAVDIQLKKRVMQSLQNNDDPALFKKIEKILQSSNANPMSLDSYYAKIDQSEKDLEEGNTKSFEEVKRKFSN